MTPFKAALAAAVLFTGLAQAADEKAPSPKPLVWVFSTGEARVAGVVVGVAAQVSVSGGVCSKASVAIGGLTAKATRASAVEAALVGKPLNEATVAAAAAQISSDLADNVNGDIHASAEYRAHLIVVMAKRAVAAAIGK